MNDPPALKGCFVFDKVKVDELVKSHLMDGKVKRSKFTASNS